jgi:hypothetical protein
VTTLILHSAGFFAAVFARTISMAAVVRAALLPAVMNGARPPAAPMPEPTPVEAAFTLDIFFG